MSEVAPRKHCLLVVDDEPEICDSVYHLLRRRYEVVRANSAAEAVEVMRQREVHVVMTDQRMPRMTGVDMLTQVRSDHPDAIRMLFTGYSDLGSVIAAINQGHVYRYLSKPFSPEELEAAVAEAAAEYERLAVRARALSQCACKVEGLERDVAELRERLGRPEQGHKG